MDKSHRSELCSVCEALTQGRNGFPSVDEEYSAASSTQSTGTSELSNKLGRILRKLAVQISIDNAVTVEVVDQMKMTRSPIPFSPDAAGGALWLGILQAFIGCSFN
jgi:hypothetical protein